MPEVVEKAALRFGWFQPMPGDYNTHELMGCADQAGVCAQHSRQEAAGCLTAAISSFAVIHRHQSLWSSACGTEISSSSEGICRRKVRGAAV